MLKHHKTWHKTKIYKENFVDVKKKSFPWYNMWPVVDQKLEVAIGPWFLKSCQNLE